MIFKDVQYMFQLKNRDDNCFGCSSCGCLRVILAVLAAISLFVVGLIIGAFFYRIIFCALAALIMLVVVLILAVFVIALFLRCRRRDC